MVVAGRGEAGAKQAGNQARDAGGVCFASTTPYLRGACESRKDK